MKHEKQQSVLFTAELQHSEETFYRLARVQAQLYGALGKVFVIFCGFALIAAALFALQESTGRLVLLFLAVGPSAARRFRQGGQRNALCVQQTGIFRIRSTNSAQIRCM